MSGQHVHFVDHEDLEAALHRLVDRLLEQRLHLVDAAVGGGVELGVVDEAAAVDVAAGLADAAGRGGDAALAVRPWQLSDLARMRDTVVLPTPRVPVNR